MEWCLVLTWARCLTERITADADGSFDGGGILVVFELQLCYYVHFQTNNLGKDMPPTYPPSYGLNSITASAGKKI